jgi:hypothetical protein
MPEQKEPPCITLFLPDFIELFLADSHSRSVPSTLADGIEQITGWKEYCYIQREECNDWRDEKITFRKLLNPILWYRQRWLEQSEHWNTIKGQSELDRIQRRIFEANVKIVTAAVSSVLSIEGDAAHSVARKLLRDKKYQNIRALGVSKLITKEEELR